MYNYPHLTMRPRRLFFIKHITYFGVRTAMWLQRNRLITGAGGSYKASNGSRAVYHTVFAHGFATSTRELLV